MKSTLIFFALGIAGVLIGGVFLLLPPKTSENQPVAGTFEALSQNGNSSCSGAFIDSIAAMPSEARLQGSCCTVMDEHRYHEQLEGLQEFAHIPEIPLNPYDVDAEVAQQFIAYDSEHVLSEQEQRAYGYAMEHSHEKGPCCCKCWRWFMYSGLGKYLIQEHGFTGEQLTRVWDLSDGCGGSGEHVHARIVYRVA